LILGRATCSSSTITKCYTRGMPLLINRDANGYSCGSWYLARTV
jgi:hypothetical protein